jgi:hypothetical protein
MLHCFSVETRLAAALSFWRSQADGASQPSGCGSKAGDGRCRRDRTATRINAALLQVNPREYEILFTGIYEGN